jgi:16S rRNA (adenine1518-N6/adenine1519-N6)-dimethyltransferase
MELTSKKEIKKLLLSQGIAPLKRLGQNFLIDKVVLSKIIKAAELKKDDMILEIGPGIGTLTQELAKIVKLVVAVEKDRRLIGILKKNLEDFKNVEIIEINILKFRVSDFGIQAYNYKVVANLPYNIAMPVIRKFLEEENPPIMMVLMIQKEVAQKICAKKSSLPKIAVEFYGKPRILFYVSKESFWPSPKVDGAVIKITDIQKNIPKIDKDLFFKILKAGFSYPRKTILNNLSKKLKLKKENVSLWLKTSGIDPQKRPEDLNLNDWLSLVWNFKI